MDQGVGCAGATPLSNSSAAFLISSGHATADPKEDKRIRSEDKE